MSRSRLITLLLVLLTVMLYLPVTRFGFVDYDDSFYVAENRAVQDGLTVAGVQWAFGTLHVANWHPVTWLSHMLDCEVFGMWAGGHHLVNVLFHAVNTGLLFVLLRRLTGRSGPAAVVAALFAWHPLHVESVAWVSERKDVLSTFFGLLALLSYDRYVRTGQKLKLWLAWAWFGLALMSKPMLVTLPCLMLLLDWWPLQRIQPAWRQNWRPLLGEKIPFFILTLASCGMTLLAQHAGHAVVSLENLPFRYRLINAVDALENYLLKILWPENLSILYPFTKISTSALVVAIIVLGGISIFAWQMRRRDPCWLMGWLWFVGTLVPVIGLVQVGSAAMADRYSYIPAIGIFIALVFGLDSLAGSRLWLKKVFAVTAGLCLTACLVVTRNQIFYWTDTETLFRHAIAVADNSDLAHNYLGAALERQGRYEEALEEYRRAADINPVQIQHRFYIGNMLLKLGRPAAALEEYRQCQAKDPDQASFHDAAGCALADQGKFTEALTEFSRAKQLDTNYAKPYVSVARMSLLQGDVAGARAELLSALRLAPFSRDVLCDAARIFAASPEAAIRDGSGAVELASKASEFSKEPQMDVLDVLGMAFAEAGNFTNAVNCAEAALEIAQATNYKNQAVIRRRLELYRIGQPWRETNTSVAR